METNEKPRKTITQFVPRIVGICLIITATAILIVPEYLAQGSGGYDMFSASFLLNFAMCVAYLIYLTVNHYMSRKLEWKRITLLNFRLLIVLFTISAFTLNIELSVISEPILWLKIYMVITQLPFIMFAFQNELPQWMKKVTWFLSGAGTVIAVYFAALMIPTAAIGVMFCWFFGVSLHALVSHVWLMAYIMPLFTNKDKSLRHYFLFGAAIPTIIAGLFMIQYVTLKRTFEKIEANNNSDLPEWVVFSQQLPDDYFTEWAIKCGLFYDHGKFWSEPNFFFSSGRGGQHEPMALIAATLFGKPEIDYSILSKVIETKYNYRHESIPRFWSDENLETKSIHTDVEVWPDYRLAYVEKTIAIHNSHLYNQWSFQEEAIYSFQMPEGAVVTSLSLWINGVEEKARLTTNEKADSAYSTIVGIENRDPSVAQWHEGNRLIVRIFPCTPDEDRKFKIGFTVPMLYADNKLSIEKIFFEGPHFTSADESVDVRIEGTNNNVDMSQGFSQIADNKWSYNGSFIREWKMEMDAPVLSDNAFSFNGKSFHLQELIRHDKSFNPASIYLDLNRCWKLNEVEEVMSIFPDCKIYVYNNDLSELTQSNYRELFDEMSKYKFSMFPIYKINNPENSLLITKSKIGSPLLEDISTSSFYTNTFNYLENAKAHIKIFNLNSDLSVYFQILKEYQVIDYLRGDINDLKNIELENNFPTYRSENDRVSIEPANVAVVRDSATVKTKAPDHLMRLFAYNMILRETGKHRFEKEYLDCELVELAKEAYVVSPVSGLVVLESQIDYERFDIEDPDKSGSLKNASQSDTGAVPEPHEWALIVLSFILAVGLYLRARKRKSA